MHWFTVKALPRISFGTSSAMKVSMVTSSTPMPTPAMNRQMSIHSTESPHAMITVMTEYHSRAQVKIFRRPNLSAK